MRKQFHKLRAAENSRVEISAAALQAVQAPPLSAILGSNQIDHHDPPVATNYPGVLMQHSQGILEIGEGIAARQQVETVAAVRQGGDVPYGKRKPRTRRLLELASFLEHPRTQVERENVSHPRRQHRP